MTGGSGGSSEQVARILAQLVIHGPVRVEELQKLCDSMSKRTFYLALKEAEGSGLLVRVRKSRKNVLVQLNSRKPEVGKAKEVYDQQRKLLGLYYTPNWETALREALFAASESRSRKELRRLIFEQARLFVIASMVSLFLEATLDDLVLQVQREISNLLLQRHKQVINDVIKDYGRDAATALEEWYFNQAKEVTPKIRVHG